MDNLSSRWGQTSLTRHGYLSHGQKEGDGGGETLVEDEVREEKRPGEDYQGGNQVDQVIDTERDHKSGEEI